MISLTYLSPTWAAYCEKLISAGAAVCITALLTYLINDVYHIILHPPPPFISYSLKIPVLSRDLFDDLCSGPSAESSQYL
jgi:hypothetical protein